MENKPHILVIGAGLAGMYFSLRAASYAKITLVCKDSLIDSNTYFAQGGIAAAVHPGDSVEKHVADTLEAGDGLCDREVVKQLLKQAPEPISRLLLEGIGFTKNEDGSLNLSREGGHSEARVLHVHDQTGQYLIKHLAQSIQDNPNIQILEHMQVVDLFMKEKECQGAWAINKHNQELLLVQADITVLATGGGSGIFKQNTNPPGATGDGYAMAWRAGAELNNMEFVQFHPTMFYVKDHNAFLISETLRGYGAELKLPDGRSFMKDYHTLGSLAPRDTVARAIMEQMEKYQLPCVYLDATTFSENELKEKFPYIFAKCMEQGINPALHMIPVVPAAHYFCGGIATNADGETSLSHLFAIGECACTGLHGANRLASNSLLEALVVAENCQQKIKKLMPTLSATEEKGVLDICRLTFIYDDELARFNNPAELQNMMWNFCGILRKETTLKLFRNLLRSQLREIKACIRKYGLVPELIDQANRIQTACLVTDAAWRRKESRGCHMRKDFPEKNSFPEKSVSRNPQQEQLIHIFEEAIHIKS